MKLKLSIAACTLILSCIGVIMIYSASSYSAYYEFGDEFFYVKKQAISLAVGIVAALFGAKVNIRVIKKFSWVIYGLSLVLLGLVFVPGLGIESYGSTRWLNLGVFSLQPSEISKFGLMFFLAFWLSEHPPINFRALIIPILCGMSICLLIMLEPNMSITMCVGLAFIVVLFASGLPKKALLILGLLVAVAIPVLIFAEPYRVKRLMAFIDPWKNPKSEGYQLIQSYYALGAGGLFGVGLFKSRQKYLFLPFAESDFIFSVIGEELGLFGCITIIFVFLVYTVSGILIALRARDNYSRLLAVGITSVIALQALINMAVVTGSIPPTGLPLPFVSAGGSALVTCMFCSGVLINTDSSPSKKLRHSM